MSCLIIPKNSQLEIELNSHFGEGKGSAIYSSIIRNDILGDASFNKFLESRDYEKLETGEPTLDVFLEYEKYLDHYNKISKVFSTFDFQTTSIEFMQLSKGITISILDELYKQGMGPIDLFETEINGLNINNIKNKAIRNVLDSLRKEHEDFEKEDETRIPNMINAIENNFAKFSKTYDNYLKTVLNIDLSSEEILDDRIEESDESEKSSKDTAFNKSSNEFSPVDNAPNVIKILIYSLKDPNFVVDNDYNDENGENEKNELGLPITVDYNKTFNYLQQELSAVNPTIENYTNKIKEISQSNPEYLELLNKLNFGKESYYPSSDKNAYFREQRLRTAFVNQFNQTKLEYVLHIKDENGNVRIKNSNLDRIENIITGKWQSNFEKILSSTPNLKDEIIKRNAEQEYWLDLIGIDVDPTLVPLETLSAIWNFGIKDNKLENLYESRKGEGVLAQIQSIAKLEANLNAETTNHQHFNGDNKLVYGITLNTYLSSLVKDLNYYAGNKSKIEELYPELFDSDYSISSRWLLDIVNGEKFEMGAYDGFKTESNKSQKTSKDLKETDINIQRIIGMLMEGKYPFLRAADRGIENFFGIKGKTKTNGLFVNSKLEASSYLLEHLESELMTMLSDQSVAHFIKNNKNVRAFYITDKDGNKESIFEYLNPEIKKLNKQKKDSSELIESEIIKMLEDLDSPKISKFIDIMLSQLIENESKALDKYRVFRKKGDKYVYLQEVIDLYHSEEIVKEMFALNSFIGYIEQTKLLIGDLAYYKNPSDVFKRMSMLNSNKQQARTDEEMLAFINTLKHNQTNKTEITSKLNTRTINDIETDVQDYSTEFDNLLRNTFGEEYQKYADMYNGMNEGDGFAYMTYDQYRIGSIMLNEWNDVDENLYQQLTSGELSQNKMYNKYKELLRNVTPKKYQYTGKMTTPDNHTVIAGRKFAIIPLVPGISPKGTVLDKMLNGMIENEVDMVFYKSAAKFGYSSEIQDMYDKQGNYQLDFTKSPVEELDWKYMGNQLKIHNKGKTKITESTQKRKIIMSNFYENGAIVDSKMKNLIEKYIDLQSKIIDRNYKNLSKQLEKDNTGDVNVDNLVNMLVITGLEQDYSTNELESLAFLKEVPFLDILPNKPQIESLVMAKMKKAVISAKRNGDSAAQIPDVGFEIDETTKKHAERHNLKFYRESKDGKKTLPMEIMIALPTELINYVKDVYGDGVYSQEALDEFNRDLIKANEEFEKTGDLNKLKPEHSELIKITTYVGFRIPNQAVSSSDVARVKKFLPPYISGTIVVPKPIVAKTGSDFDIDKMFLYKPNFKVLYANDKQITNNFLKDTISIGRIKDYLDAYEIPYNKKASKSEINQIFANKLLLTEIPSNHKNLSNMADVLKRELAFSGIAEGFEYIKDESDKGIDNQLLETEIAITLHDSNIRQLITPIDGTTIHNAKEPKKGTVGKIRELRGESSNVDHISDVFTNSKNIEKFIAFLSGKGGVGQVAVHITNHVLAQMSGLKMKSLHNYFGNNEEFIELGNINNIKGQNISELLSEMLTAYVDIAKDPYIIDLNALQSTANTILMMLRWGMDPNVVFKFINQPIIIDYVREQSFNESIVNTGDSNLNQPKWKNQKKEGYVMQVMKKYNPSIKPQDLISWNQKEYEESDGQSGKVLENVYDQIKESDLNDGIKNNRQDASQIKYLDLFLEYQRQSTIFQTMVRSTSPDTQGFKNFTTLENQLKLKKEVEKTGMFENYDKMFDGFIGEFYNKKQEYMNLIKNLYMSQNPNYKKQLDELKDMVLKNVRGIDSKQRVLDRIENGFISFILNKKFNYKKEFDSLFIGENSIPKVIQKMQKDFKDNGITNSFLDLIIPTINQDKRGFDTLKPKTKKMSTFDRETIISYFKELELYNDDIKNRYGVDDFYQKLITFQIIQSGIDNSPFSFINLIPAKDHFNFIKDVIEEASNGRLDVDAFASVDPFELGLFIRNNPNIFYGNFMNEFNVKYIDKNKAVFQVEGITVANQRGAGSVIRSYDLNSVDTQEQNNEELDEFDLWEKNNPINKETPDCKR